MINVKDAPYNATGNGTTDDSAAVAAALAALPLIGGEVYFPAGTYNLATWTSKAIGSTTAPAAPNDELGGVRLRGEAPGAVLLRGPGTASTTHKFGLIRNSLQVGNLEFENWHTVFDGTDAGAVDEVSFADCAFRDSSYFLDWTAGTGDSLQTLVVDRCDFNNLSGAVVFGSVSVSATYFTSNRVVNCQRYVLRLLSGESVEGRDLIVFSRNYVENLNAQAYSGAAAVARVLQVSCDRLVVTENYVRKVQSVEAGGNANFIYLSAVHAYVAGNYLEDVGTPGDPTGAIIQEKNYAAISGRYIGNLFVQNPPAPGQAALQPPAIQVLSGGHTVVHGNEARGLNNSLVFFSQNAGDLVVSNNVVTDSDNPYAAIAVYGGKNVVIESNVIDGVRNTHDEQDELPWQYFARGIRMERYSEPVVVNGATTYVYHAPENVRIANNVINDVRRASESIQEGSAIFLYASSIAIRNLSIVGNTITDCDTGVDLRVAGTGTFQDAEVSYNTFSGNRVNVYAPTPPLAFTTRDNRGWATDATGTATVAAAATSVVVSHGLARTPQAAGITVTPLSAPDSMGASRFWVSNVTATTFTINVDSGPGSPVTFGWTAQVG